MFSSLPLSRTFVFPKATFIHRHILVRIFSSGTRPYTQPGPPPLPAKEQREWEDLIRQRQLSVFTPSVHNAQGEEDLHLHPDARRPVQPDFQGDTNPVTGEVGGPKKEPLQWGSEGEWTYGGRSTDF